MDFVAVFLMTVGMFAATLGISQLARGKHTVDHGDLLFAWAIAGLGLALGLLATVS